MIKPWIVENQQYLESGTILMDISGVKTNIVEPVQAILREDLELISIHPMCGRESRGIDFAQADILIMPTILSCLLTKTRQKPSKPQNS